MKLHPPIATFIVFFITLDLIEYKCTFNLLHINSPVDKIVLYLFVFHNGYSMAEEIERKFLVDGDFKQHVFHSVRVIQGYLNSHPLRTVRVRIKGDAGFITVKGQASHDGVSRYEWEKEIPIVEAMELLLLCEEGVIDKMRHLVEVDGYIYEVDEFYGDNQGLVVAEIELSAHDESFPRPQWLGKEVTGDVRYYNSMLMKNPFKEWD